MAERDDDYLGEQPGPDEARRVPKSGWRYRLRSNPATRQFYRLGVFLIGLLFIALGFALAVLPGPLTIPPVLLGLYVWSTEFRFAEKLFDGFRDKAHDAWEHAKRKPVSSAVLTIAGLIGAGVAIWAVGHYDLIDKGKDLVGL